MQNLDATNTKQLEIAQHISNAAKEGNTEAFEAGDVAKAKEILDQAERKGDHMYEDYLNNKSLQQWRQSLHKMRKPH